jgi:type I restriction-modification system DNA methylase subunit
MEHCVNQQALSSLIWSVADLLRGDFKPHEYGRVILPFTVLCRLDCVLAPTKAAVLAEYREKKDAGIAYEPARLLEEIDADLQACLADNQRMIGEMSA